MDTKSKKYKWINSFVCIAMVLVLTAGAMAAVPAISERTQKFEQSLHQNWRFRELMIDAIWGTYHELMQDPKDDWEQQWDIYVPKLSESTAFLEQWQSRIYSQNEAAHMQVWSEVQERQLAICHNIQNALSNELSYRISRFQYQMENLSYQADHMVTKRHIGNVDKDLNRIFKGEMRDQYQYAIALEFSDNGTMTVQNVWADSGNTDESVRDIKYYCENIMQELQNIVSNEQDSWQSDTPLTYYQSDANVVDEPLTEVPDGSEESSAQAQENVPEKPVSVQPVDPALQLEQTIRSFKAQGPHNVRMVLAVPQRLEHTDAFWGATIGNHREALVRSGAGLLYCGMLAAAALAGLLLGLVRRWNIGNGRLMNFLPVEGLTLAVILGSIVMIDETLWVMPFIPQIWPDFGVPIANEWMVSLKTVHLISLLGGIGVWLLSTVVVFICALSLSKLFLMGPWQWLKQRSWCVRILVWLAGICRKVWLSVTQIHLDAPAHKAILGFVLVNTGVMSLACLEWFFGIIAAVIYGVFLYLYLKKKHQQAQKEYQIVLDTAGQMAQGQLDVNTDENAGPFEPLKQELTKVRSGFQKAVDAEVRSRSMKTELITNVSHDLKTPLTAIITYVDLLKNEELTPEERRSYVDTLDRKSQRLKQLIEDLFEVSRAASRDLTARLEPLDLCALLHQVRFELRDTLEGCGIDFRWELPEEKVPVLLDGQRTCRIFENLLVNITKYALPGTRAYITLVHDAEEVEISFKNISAAELDVKSHDLTDRFVRGDASRSTEGSGLGLAIAKSFVELQNGRFEIQVDGDLFKAVIHWPLQAFPAEKPQPPEHVKGLTESEKAE